MAKRRYTSTCSRFSMHLDLANGSHVVHEFKGKNVYTKERFTDVTDPEIQELLEASPAFGIYFERSHEFDYLEAEEKAEIERIRLEQEKASKDEEEKEEVDLEEGDLVEDSETGKLLVFKNGNLEEAPENTEEEGEDEKVKTFATGADAKYWLNQTMKVPSAKLTNKAKMIVEAELLGYTIEFEVK